MEVLAMVKTLDHLENQKLSGFQSLAMYTGGLTIEHYGTLWHCCVQYLTNHTLNMFHEQNLGFN
jgi:hypothetical protein